MVTATVQASFGYTRDEMIGRRVDPLVPDEVVGRHARWAAAYLAEPRALHFESDRGMVGRRRDGSLFPVEIGLDPIETPDGFHVLASVLDVTDRKRDERALREKTHELQRSKRELEEFVSVVSHDLKSPLRGIASLAEWIAAGHTHALDDEGREQLDLLCDRTIRLHQRVEGILAYSRATRDGDVRCRVETSELVHGVVELLSPPPNIQVRIEEPIPDCTCDETQLGQAFQHLIGNAIQHLGRPCGVITISGEAGPKRVTFAVRDDGVGIAPEHHARIFRIFQTLQIDPKERSTGIGLSIVQKIVRWNGGELEVESAPGEGTTFRFSMPAAQ
jgi:PAS domain S-box-containing protein